MMLNENHQNPSCEFAEELVAYLYNEMQPAEQSRFESHLNGCAFCPGELTEFGLVRNSIADWREAEFSRLPPPIIEIPKTGNIEISLVEAAPISRPWWERIREFLTLSPAWMTATTAFAALAICIGLGLVLLNSDWNSKEVLVQDDSKNKKTVPSPTTDISKQNPANSGPNQNEPQPAKSPAPNFTDHGVSNPPPAPVKAGIRTNAAKSQNLKKNEPSTIENKSNKTSPKPGRKGKAPSLIGDEDDEDDTLTLTDLLEEIGMR